MGCIAPASRRGQAYRYPRCTASTSRRSAGHTWVALAVWQAAVAAAAVQAVARVAEETRAVVRVVARAAVVREVRLAVGRAAGEVGR